MKITLKKSVHILTLFYNAINVDFKILIVVMYEKAIVRILVAVSNNMTVLFTINYHACMKRTYITTDCNDIGIYLRLR